MDSPSARFALLQRNGPAASDSDSFLLPAGLAASIVEFLFPFLSSHVEMRAHSTGAGRMSLALSRFPRTLEPIRLSRGSCSSCVIPSLIEQLPRLSVHPVCPLFIFRWMASSHHRLGKFLSVDDLLINRNRACRRLALLTWPVLDWAILAYCAPVRTRCAHATCSNIELHWKAKNDPQHLCPHGRV